MPERKVTIGGKEYTIAATKTEAEDLFAAAAAADETVTICDLMEHHILLKMILTRMIKMTRCC